MGVGLDLVNKTRFIKTLKTQSFYELILSEQEVNEYQLLSDDSRKLSFLASHFAVKEALVKCTQNKELDFRSISVKHDEQGAPILDGYNVSVSHEDDYVIAIVMDKEGCL